VQPSRNFNGVHCGVNHQKSDAKSIDGLDLSEAKVDNGVQKAAEQLVAHKDGGQQVAEH
jgi:hypothetical protein